MRSVRRAICTSALPVSLSCSATLLEAVLVMSGGVDHSRMGARGKEEVGLKPQKTQRVQS
jgi:hypothetical protein